MIYASTLFQMPSANDASVFVSVLSLLEAPWPNHGLKVQPSFKILPVRIVTQKYSKCAVFSLCEMDYMNIWFF